MTPSESDAIEAFERLGLTSYESKVFIALQQLGSGTARDVSRVTDVPRSQVYSVAESLEDRALLEVQQASPIRYRPVSVDEARQTLTDRFEAEQERAFEYVESVREDAIGEEEQEDIWTVRGRERVDDRVVELLADADDRILFGARLSALVTDEIEAKISARAADGLEVIVFSRTAAVRDRFTESSDVAVMSPPDHRSEDERSGRIAIVDDDTILLSVVDENESETAFWSAGSLFASVLIQLIEASAEAPGS